ncbi:MAG: hypothetical protein HYZ74_07540 [Elusimicrobia bacterium]|nr:hypothetical protein [Elusimicrobiota bacterium]
MCSWGLRSRSDGRRRLGAILGAALAACLGAAEAHGARVEIVVDALTGDVAPVVRALRQAVGEPVKIHEISKLDLADPIGKGRFLANLNKADLLIPVGEAASRFVSRELADTPAFFVGATVLEGGYLAAASVGGYLAYDPSRILQVASGLGLKKIGIVYTPGYDDVAARIAAVAAPTGVRLIKARVRSRDDIVPALERIFGQANAVWVLGDPALVRGAGFEFLIEKSLARSIPVIAVSPWEVERGALFCLQIKTKDLAGPAASYLGELMRGRGAFPSPRARTSDGGVILFNQELMQRWGLRPPAGVPWQMIPSRP